jgi:hypothetical protein
MRELPVDLDEETLEALETERRLTGFESRAAYVRWIVDQRGSIGDDTGERNRLLESYRRRVETLERRLESESTTGLSEGRDQPSSSPGPDASANDESGSAETNGEGDDGKRDDGERDGQTTRAAPTGGGWRPSRSDPTVEVRGRPRTVRQHPDGEGTASTAETEPKPATDDVRQPADGGSGSLTPERVVRIAEDPVAADADVLDAVAVERLDELSRRAVAKTRERLDRDVETGLEYRSTTPLAGDDVLPGADLVDLESLSVPGRSDEQLARRRAVAGRAIAFLRDEGRARKAEFVEALYDDYPAGYATADGWWSFLRDVLGQIETVDGGDGARVWRYAD